MYVNKVLSEQNAFRLFAGELRNIFIVIDSAGRFKDTKKYIYIGFYMRNKALRNFSFKYIYNS